MRTLAVLGLWTMLVSAIVDSSNAQQLRLRDRLVGAWTLVSCERTTASGTKQPYCVDPNGILTLDASGRYAHMIAARGRPKLTRVNRTDAPAEEYKAAAEGFVAN